MHHLFLSPASFPDHTFLCCSLHHSPSLLRRRLPTATVCGSQHHGRSGLSPTPAPLDQIPSAPHHHLSINTRLHTRLNSPPSSSSPSGDQIPCNLSIPVPRPSSLSSAMATSPAEMEPLTSGASNRIIPILKALRSALVFVHSFVISLLVVLLPLRRRRHHSAEEQPSPVRRRKSLWRMEEEDTLRRRALAEGLEMGFDDASDGDRELRYRWGTSLFFGVRHNALFCRSWIPVSGELK